MTPRSDIVPDARALRAAVLLTVAAAAILFFFHARRIVATNDEGIILDAALRVAAGQSPYVDFWGHMSPGSYWIQALVFQFFGISLWTARLPVILGFSIQCGLTLWLVSRFASFRAAVFTGIVFFGFQVADPAFLTSQHRWDSGTLALAAVCLLLAARERGGLGLSGFAGGLGAVAAWCTPSMALVLLTGLIWLAWLRRWRAALAWCLGVTVVGFAGAGWMAAEGSLPGLWRQMVWLGQNYGAVNVVPYGSVIGGYARLFEGVSGAAAVMTGLLVFFVALPAILPPLSALLWGLVHWRTPLPKAERASLALLLPVSAALAATTLPRPDVMHLALIAALPAALSAAALARLTPPLPAIVPVIVGVASLLFASNHFRAWAASSRLDSPVGTVLVEPAQREALAGILSRVRPSDSLLVHPYMPLLYFLTRAGNSSRFSFFCPGMMTAEQESELLSSVAANPPVWVLYQPVTREDFLRVFPNGAVLNHRFERIESWIQENYEPPPGPPIQFAGYSLLRRRANSGERSSAHGFAVLNRTCLLKKAEATAPRSRILSRARQGL